jgi:hypothetical protein
MRVKGKASTLGEAITVNAVVSYWNLILYCIPVASVALIVLPKRSSRTAHGENCMGCQGSVVGQLRTDLITLCNLSMASSWESCAPGVSSRGSTDKLGDVGCCGRRGQRQSHGPVVSLQPIRIALSFTSNAMTNVFVKITQQPAFANGARPMRLWGKPAMMGPTRLDAGRSGTDASLALAIDCTGVPLATWTSIVGAVAS